MKTFSLLLVLIGVLCLVADNVAAAGCEWRGTAPLCGYYCNEKDNLKYINADKEVIKYIYKVGETCVAENGNYNNACPAFGEGCTNGGCKVYVCPK
jgi:hypothetical protein